MYSKVLVCTIISYLSLINADYCNLEKNVDYLGNDLGNSSSAMPQECCNKCSEFKGCSAFTWSDYNGGTCWFKSDKYKSVYKQNCVSSSVYSKKEIEADVDVLQYALILEHLESAFYKEGMQNFTSKNFTDAGYDNKTYINFQNISSHEAAHVIVLNNTITSLGYTGVPPCTYNFPYTDVKSFIALAKLLEQTGVRAYIGAIHLININDYKRVGASIEAIEARHSSYLNSLSNNSPFPDAFEPSLNQRSVVGIASILIKECPFKLPINPYSPLAISPASGMANSNLTLNSTKLNSNDSAGFAGSNNVYCSFLFSLNQTWSSVSNNTCQVPSDVTGEVYVFLTNDNTTIIALDSQSSVLAGPTTFNVTT